MELEGEFGGGLFAGAGAVEDDVAVARDDLAVLAEFVGADAKRAGKNAGIGEMKSADDAGQR